MRNIINIIYICMIVLAIGIVIRSQLPKTRKQNSIVLQESATVIRKETYEVANYGSRVQPYRTSFEVTFLMPSNKEKTMVMESLFYQRLEIGDTGVLKYTKAGEFIAFGDKIKERGCDR